MTYATCIQIDLISNSKKNVQGSYNSSGGI